jgi:CDP-paratose 2-epimerase
MHQPASDLRPRPYDVPWIVMDNSYADADFGWSRSVTLAQTLAEVAAHAQCHPDWLERSGL